MEENSPGKMGARQRPSFRNGENAGREKRVEKPVTTLEYQLACSGRIPSFQVGFDDPINEREGGRQDPGGGDEHPWFQALPESHRANVSWPEANAQLKKTAAGLIDRSSQQMRRSCTHRCGDRACPRRIRDLDRVP